MKFEQLRQRPLRTAGLAIAVGLASLTLAACGNDSGERSEAIPTETAEGAGVSYTYFEDGSRLTQYSDSGFADILAFCDGPDMLEQTDFATAAYKAGNAIFRSVDHPACADGKLTASDFKIAG